MKEWIYSIKRYRIPKATIKFTSAKVDSKEEQWIYHCKQVKSKK